MSLKAGAAGLRERGAAEKQAYGDWQTPRALAEEVLAVVARYAGAPAVILEPTCGEGTFLAAAAARYEAAALVGFEIDEGYAAEARRRLPPERARITRGDFFAIDWRAALAALPGPLLVLGNPPWVTSAAIGALGASNLPGERRALGLAGLDALTGKSNFDVSEWMILRLLEALAGRPATVAFLCKSSVARRLAVSGASGRQGLRPLGLWRIDARRHFRAAVDAVLLLGQTGPAADGPPAWPIYDAIDAAAPREALTIVEGRGVASLVDSERTAHLAGVSDPEWRSGIKHDCARVMELRAGPDGALRNGLGERVDLEPDYLFPLLKSSDVANATRAAGRFVLVPQRSLGEPTSSIAARAPKTWAYLQGHRRLLAARKSVIYRGQPDFSIFGVGAYSFAPWKVAISGLYKRLAFSLVKPRQGRPAMLDDTCYFLPFDTLDGALEAWVALNSAPSRSFLQARIFWDAKRPINKALLQQLDLRILLREILGGRDRES